jgi:Rhodanese-like domain
VLDARSAEKYGLLHVKAAKNLSLPDFTADELKKIIPEKSTRVLIYCNNNFENEPVAFASKVARASLNIYTYNSLYSYGYTNVYELGPLLDIKKSKLPFEGTSVQQQVSAAFSCGAPIAPTSAVR